jgi:hypothetical protein
MEPPEPAKPSCCPECGGTELLRIVYGYPGPEMFEEAERGEVRLGGCVISGDMPDWACVACDHQWFDPTDPAHIEFWRELEEED